MTPDFGTFFERYEALAREIDQVVERVGAEHGQRIACTPGCSDCCHALFDLTLVEAMYLNAKFNERYSGQSRSDLLTRADEADRKAYRVKREAFRLSRDGARTTEILEYMAKARVRCPLLDDDDRCALYEHRPLTCRLYGIPTAIRGKAHTCAKCGFAPGEQYPTVKIELLQDRLLRLSHELTASLRTRYARLGETLVPVSMALMNRYDAEYLGLMSDEEWEKAERLRAMLGEQGAPPRPAPARPAPGGVAAQAFAAPAQGPGSEGRDACASCDQAKGSDACATCGTLNWELGGGRS